MSLFIRALTFVSVLFSFASAAQASDRLVLESVDGDRVVIVTDGKTLEPHPAKQGEELHFWDVIQTSKRAAAKVRFPDGSLLVIGRDTKFTIQPKNEGTQFNQLDWGQVRAQVVPDENAKNADPKAPKPKPRFIIRTRTAVMGVRGTDFVAGFDPSSAQSSLHTIEGSVDIAANESQVMAWQGTPVNAGQSASMDTVSSEPAVAQFQPQEYKAQMETAQPELSKVPDRPPSTEGAPPASASSTADARLSLLSFRVGALSILQDAKIQYTNVALSWNPVMRLFSIFSIRGHAGGTRIKNGLTGNQFPVVKAGLLADIELPLSLHAEVGAGQMAFITDAEGTLSATCFIGNIAWRFAPDKWLDAIYAGATMLKSDDSGDTSHMPFEASAGVGLRF